MRFGTIFSAARSVAICEVEPGSAVAIGDLLPGVANMLELIDAGDAGLDTIRKALAVERQTKALKRIATASCDWRAPVENPSNIFCVALNNTTADPSLIYRPAFPAYFTKPTSALTGHCQPIELFPHYGLTHNEPELAVIVGRGGRHISEANALDHVFGYTIVNDVTSVGMRKEDRFHGGYPTSQPDGSVLFVEEHLTYPARYKGADTFAPLGPWITTKDEIADPGNLAVKCWLDDELIFDDTTANLHHSVARTIFWISAHATLKPGDVLTMGTAGHPDRKRKPLSYGNINQRGARVRIAIEGLGTLENPLDRKPAPDPRSAFPPVEGLGTDLRAHGLTKADAVKVG